MKSKEMPEENKLNAVKEDLKNLLENGMSIDELINTLSGLGDGQISEHDINDPKIADIIQKFKSAGCNHHDFLNLAHGIEDGQEQL